MCRRTRSYGPHLTLSHAVAAGVPAGMPGRTCHDAWEDRPRHVGGAVMRGRTSRDTWEDAEVCEDYVAGEDSDAWEDRPGKDHGRPAGGLLTLREPSRPTSARSPRPQAATARLHLGSPAGTPCPPGTWFQASLSEKKQRARRVLRCGHAGRPRLDPEALSGDDTEDGLRRVVTVVGTAWAGRAT